MERLNTFKIQKHGAWNWTLRRLGEIRARLQAPTTARMKLAVRMAEGLKSFLDKGLIHKGFVLGLLELLGNLTARWASPNRWCVLDVSPEEVGGWIALARHQLKTAKAEDLKEKAKLWKEKIDE